MGMGYEGTGDNSTESIDKINKLTNALEGTPRPACAPHFTLTERIFLAIYFLSCSSNPSAVQTSQIQFA
jgi:hypothetical protein